MVVSRLNKGAFASLCFFVVFFLFCFVFSFSFGATHLGVLPPASGLGMFVSRSRSPAGRKPAFGATAAETSRRTPGLPAATAVGTGVGDLRRGAMRATTGVRVSSLWKCTPLSRTLSHQRPYKKEKKKKREREKERKKKKKNKERKKVKERGGGGQKRGGGGG